MPNERKLQTHVSSSLTGITLNSIDKKPSTVRLPDGENELRWVYGWVRPSVTVYLTAPDGAAVVTAAASST